MPGSTFNVYVQADTVGNIVSVGSDDPSFGFDILHAIKIDSGTDLRYHHASGNYFGRPLMEKSVYRFMLADSAASLISSGKAIIWPSNKLIAEKTNEQILSEVPLPLPTPEEEISSLRQQISSLDAVIFDLMTNVLTKI
jgi:hypothetical protein